MSDLFQKIKKESMITSIICIVFGVMFCIWPGTILVTLCRIAGLVMLAAGIVLLVQGDVYKRQLQDRDALKMSSK